VQAHGIDTRSGDRRAAVRAARQRDGAAGTGRPDTIGSEIGGRGATGRDRAAGNRGGAPGIGSDTDGTVTAPDGSSSSFSLPTDMVALFANPVELCIGSTPGSVAGIGEYFDINRITITNQVQVDDDDFTQDDVLNTSLWNPAFSLNAASANNAGSVFQVSTNTPFWINWTLPDDLFQLATAPSLTNQWFSTAYYGSLTGVSNSIPTKMGSLKWTLINAGALPTIDTQLGSPVSPNGFFRLQNPGPAQ